MHVVFINNFQSRPQTASYREATNQTRRLGFSEYTKRTRHNMLQLLAVLKYGRSVGLVRDRNGAAGASFVRPLAVCASVWWPCVKSVAGDSSCTAVRVLTWTDGQSIPTRCTQAEAAIRNRYVALHQTVRTAHLCRTLSVL